MPNRWVIQKHLDAAKIQAHLTPGTYVQDIRLGEWTLHECAMVFFDLVNFTNISWSLSTEQLMAILQPLFIKASEYIDSYGGIVDKFPGDGVVGFFPRTYSSGEKVQVADNALDCAASVMRWFYHDLAPYVDLPKQSHNLELCAGVDAGQIAIAHVGSAIHSELILLGDQVNCACKCQAVADKREVVVGQDAVNRLHFLQLVQPYLSTGPATNIVYTKDNRRYLSYRFDWERYASDRSWVR